MAKDLMEGFLRYDWPGNVRQLENVVKRYLILPDADIAAELRGGPPEPVAQPVQTADLSLKEVAGHAAEVAEKEVVLRVLEETGWNRKESARRLRISYKALRNKLKKWQFVKERPSEGVRTLVKSA
jgi:two-component system, NtrC family, response regulator AtoC